MKTSTVAPACRTGTDPGSDRLVCQCMQVTESEIREGISAMNEPTVEDLSCLTGAGTGCTACRSRIERLLLGKSACGAFGLCEGCGCCFAVCGCSPEQAERCPSARPCGE